MNKIIAIQISLFVIFAGAFFGLLYDNEVYDDVERKIVEELCLSCVKLKPYTSKEFRFLSDSNGHPDFILDNLTKGPVLLDYRITFCPGCEELEEHILSKVFDYSYPSDDLHVTDKEFKETTVTFIHMNTDVFPRGSSIESSRSVYDIIGDEGNPMLVFITLGYNHGIIEPYYCTLYSLGSGNYEQDSTAIQKELTDLIYEMVDLYNEHYDAWK